MEKRTKWLVVTAIFGTVSSTMFIGNLFFNSEFGMISFIFLVLQFITLLIAVNVKE